MGLRPHRINSVCHAKTSAPGPDSIWAIIAYFKYRLIGIIQALQCLSFKPNSECFFILLSDLVFGRRLNCHTRLYTPKEKRFQHRVGNNMVDCAIGPVDIISFFVVIESFRKGDHRRRSEKAQTVATIAKIDYNGIVRSPLVAPFRICNDRIVVIDQLPSHAHAIPLCLWIAKLRITKLQIPSIQIRRTIRRFLQEWAGILYLCDYLHPFGGLDRHLEPRTEEHIRIVVAQLKTAVAIALIAKSFFPSE